jgi:hypothetical protein
LDFVVVHWLKELLLQAQMPVGGFRCLYRHVIPDVDIGICSTIYICGDTYLKLEWQLLLSLLWELWLPVFITLVLILPANFSTTGIDFCNDTYARVYWEISIKVY